MTLKHSVDIFGSIYGYIGQFGERIGIQWGMLWKHKYYITREVQHQCILKLCHFSNKFTLRTTTCLELCSQYSVQYSKELRRHILPTWNSIPIDFPEPSLNREWFVPHKQKLKLKVENAFCIVFRQKSEQLYLSNTSPTTNFTARQKCWTHHLSKLSDEKIPWVSGMKSSVPATDRIFFAWTARTSSPEDVPVIMIETFQRSVLYDIRWALATTCIDICWPAQSLTANIDDLKYLAESQYPLSFNDQVRHLTTRNSHA